MPGRRTGSASSDLVDRLLTGLLACGLRLQLGSDLDTRPASVLLRSKTRELDLILYVWRCTHGGPPTVRAEDEWRVQTTRPDPGPLRRSPATRTVLAGYWEEGNVFVFWNPDLHAAPGTSSSLQVGESTLQDAQKDGWSIQDREISGRRVERVVACTPGNICKYLLAPHPTV